MRRDFAQRAAARRLAGAYGFIVLAWTIGTMLGGFFFQLIAIVIGSSMAGQTLSPSVSRTTRGYMYPAVAVLILLGALTGWTIGHWARAMGRPAPVFLFLETVVFFALVNPMFWVLLALTAVIIYIRMR